MSCVNSYLNEDEVPYCKLDDTPCLPEKDEDLSKFCSDYDSGLCVGCEKVKVI
jgi:hypothetical protein